MVCVARLVAFGHAQPTKTGLDHCGCCGLRRELSRLRLAGQQVPQGLAAVGWQVAVYDEEDQVFFSGTIATYLADTGCHVLQPFSSKPVVLDLAASKTKWLSAPLSSPPARVRRSSFMSLHQAVHCQPARSCSRLGHLD